MFRVLVNRKSAADMAAVSKESAPVKKVCHHHHHHHHFFSVAVMIGSKWKSQFQIIAGD